MRVLSSRLVSTIGRVSCWLSNLATSAGFCLLRVSTSASKPLAWPVWARLSRSATEIERMKAPLTNTTLVAAWAAGIEVLRPSPSRAAAT